MTSRGQLSKNKCKTKHDLSIGEKQRIAMYVATSGRVDTDDLQFWKKVIEDVVSPSSKKLCSPAQLRNLYMKEIYKTTFEIKMNQQPVVSEKTEDMSAHKIHPVLTQLNGQHLIEIKKVYEAFKNEALRNILMQNLAKKLQLQGLDVSSDGLIYAYEVTFGERSSVTLQTLMQKAPLECLEPSKDFTDHYGKVELPTNLFKGERFVILFNEISWLSRSEMRFVEYLIVIYGGHVVYDAEKCDPQTVIALHVEDTDNILEIFTSKYKQIYSKRLITKSIENGTFDKQQNKMYLIAEQSSN